MGVQGLKVCSFLLISYCDDFVLQFSIEKCSNIDVEVNKLIAWNLHLHACVNNVLILKKRMGFMPCIIV